MCVHVHVLHHSATRSTRQVETAVLDLALFPGPTKERRGPGTHCSRMRGLHGNQVTGVIDEAQTELVYL